jgi:hypothetical protein
MNKIVMYIGDRKTGKTTRLLREFNKFSIILDCAVEHPEYSLICKIKESEPTSNLIQWKHLFPFLKNPRKFLNKTPLLFDVSFFLERAHDIPFLSPLLFFLYYCHVHLIISALNKGILHSNCPFKIILDEVKMSTTTQRFLLVLAKKFNLEIKIAIHRKQYLCLLAKKARLVYLQQKFK